MPVSVRQSTFRRHACAFLATLLCAWPGESPLAQEPVYEAASIKAAFLYHFATFVIWPESAASGDDFVIAVLGDEDISKELSTYLPGRTIQGRPMRARSIDTAAELSGAAMLFIGAAHNDELAGILSTVEHQPVLVVTDAPAALDKGAMINFKIVEDRVRFEISLRSAERAGLVMSSRLLSAAMFVDTTSAVLDLPSVSIVSNTPGVRLR